VRAGRVRPARGGSRHIFAAMPRHLLLLTALVVALVAAPASAQTNPTPPGVSTSAATSITRTTATIPGSVDPNGAATTYHVEYGTTDAYGLQTAAAGAGAGTAPVAVSVALTGLTANTTYHYRLVATNAAGIGRSANRTLRTAAPPRPGVTIGPAGVLQPNTVTVSGSVNPRGAPTTYRFEYGRGTRLNLRTARVAAGAGTAPVPVSATLNVAPATSYSYRLVATNSAGTTRSARRTFVSPAACLTRHSSKLSLARATPTSSALDVLAPITSRASGRASVEYHAAQRRTRFSAAVNSAAGWIRFRRSIPAVQARLRTGILTLRYPGDSDTRPQTVRLRAAANKAHLNLTRPQIVGDRILAAGTVSDRARGVVRLQLEYQLNCIVRVLHFRGTISGGRWVINEPLPPATLAEIARRTGALHSYTLFTGYLPARMRGEMRAFQVLGNP